MASFLLLFLRFALLCSALLYSVTHTQGTVILYLSTQVPPPNFFSDQVYTYIVNIHIVFNFYLSFSLLSYNYFLALSQLVCELHNPDPNLTRARHHRLQLPIT